MRNAKNPTRRCLHQAYLHVRRLSYEDRLALDPRRVVEQRVLVEVRQSNGQPGVVDDRDLGWTYSGPVSRPLHAEMAARIAGRRRRWGERLMAAADLRAFIVLGGAAPRWAFRAQDRPWVGVRHRWRRDWEWP
jgi:hypothetical protein